MNIQKIWHEKLYSHLGQYFQIDELLYETKTRYHEVIIFKNSTVGKVLAIDKIVQTSEKDEFIYHEMLAHVPIFAHNAVKKVLIIGGGDGGILREVCRHKNIEHITIVEIDKDIIHLCQKYFPNHSKNSYQDPRVKLIINNGLTFVQKTKEKFDIIISDSTDPISYGKDLFSLDFYSSCKNCLYKNGIFVAQNSVFFLQKKEMLLSYQKLKKCFDNTKLYSSSIPTYYGGSMLFSWSTNNLEYNTITLQQLQKNIQNANLSFNYYNAKIHISSFYLPQYILNALNKSSNIFL